MAPWLAPQLFITLYTSRKGPPGWVRGTNQCVGQVGSVRSSRVLWTASGRSTVQPSATCSTGPRPSTRLRRDIVQGLPPRGRNPEENPPRRDAGELVPGDALHRGGAPVRADVGEDLGGAREQVPEQHGEAIEGV